MRATGKIRIEGMLAQAIGTPGVNVPPVIAVPVARNGGLQRGL